MDPQGNILADQIRDAGYVTYLQDMRKLQNDPLSKGANRDISKKKGQVADFEVNEELIEKISLQNEDDEEDENIINTSSKKTIAKGMELNAKKSLKEVADKILDKEELEDKFRENELMKELSLNIGNLFTYLEQKMPPITFGKSPKKDSNDTEALDAGCLFATALYNDVQKSIGKFLDNPSCFDENPDVRRQLESMSIKIKDESALFRQKVFDYREMVRNAKEVDKEDKEPTWQMALKYQRADVIDLNDEKKYRTAKVGGATSTRLRISTIGLNEKGEEEIKEEVFFQKSEKVALYKDVTMITEFMREKIAETPKNEDILKEVFDALKNDLGHKNIGKSSLVDFLISKASKPASELYESLNNQDEQLDVLDCLSEMTAKERKLATEYLSEFSRRLFQRKQCNRIRIKPDSNISDRNVATSRLAQLFGIQNIICDSRSAVVQRNKDYVKGCAMAKAEGDTSPNVLKLATAMECKVSYSDKAINQLFSMQIFDFICGQVDRTRNNYFVQTKEDYGNRKMVVDSIQGFDNDMSFGSMTFDMLKKGYNRIALITEENLKGIPIQLVNTIMHLDRHALDYILCDILSREELNALWNRISGVKSGLMKLKGLKYDEKTSRYYYEGEDSDDTLRQLKQLKANKNTELNTVFDYRKTPFLMDFVDVEDLEDRIQKRRAQ